MTSCMFYKRHDFQDPLHFQFFSTHFFSCSFGADHDGEGNSCDPENEFIMAPSTALFNKSEPYSVNPWKFSSCSIAYFKTFMNQMR